MKTLIFDCDPGVDDALAFFLSLSHLLNNRIQNIRILTTSGNVGVNQTTANIIRLITLAVPTNQSIGEKIKVYKGSNWTLDGRMPLATSVHGRDGLGEVPLRFLDKDFSVEKALEQLKATKKKVLQPKRASEFLLDLKKDEHDIILVCTGPLTNLATALSHMSPEHQKEFWAKFSKVVIMGGAINVPGNVTPFAEFNFHSDPLAAKIVLESWERVRKDANNEKLYLVPLDITQEIGLLWNEEEYAGDEENLICRFVTAMLQKYFRFHSLMVDYSFFDKDNGKYILRKMSPERRKEIRKELIVDKGVKKLPRFCYLHDPLAMYFALEDLDDSYLKASEISISTDPGETRGMCFDVIARPAPITALMIQDDLMHSEGAKVHYLTDKFIWNGDGTLNPICNSFLSDFKKAIGFKCKE